MSFKTLLPDKCSFIMMKIDLLNTHSQKNNKNKKYNIAFKSNVEFGTYYLISIFLIFSL